MRKAIMLFGLILAVSFSAAAQGKFEVAAGYTYAHENSTDSVVSNGNGGGLDVGFFPFKHFGIIAAVNGLEYASFTFPVDGVTNTYHASTTSFSYLFGPRMRYGAGPLSIYWQVLAGGVSRSSITDSDAADLGTSNPCGPGGPIPCTFDGSRTSWALAPAVGVDLNLGDHWAIRAAQVGETLTNFPSVKNGNNELQYTFTLSTGIVYRF